jgi:hypothetical protein
MPLEMRCQFTVVRHHLDFLLGEYLLLCRLQSEVQFPGHNFQTGNLLADEVVCLVEFYPVQSGQDDLVHDRFEQLDILHTDPGCIQGNQSHPGRQKGTCFLPPLWRHVGTKINVSWESLGTCCGTEGCEAPSRRATLGLSS